MNRRDGDQTEISAALLVGGLLAAACVAGIAPAGGTAGSLLAFGAGAGAEGADRRCGNCGVVEEVRALDPRIARHEFSTIAGGGIEGIAVALAALGGKLRIEPSSIHQVVVRMDDGSIRILRTATPPRCRPGERVKVVMARIVPA